MKILKYILTAIVLLNVSQVHLKAQNRPDSIEISLLTASPGDETYSAFGHSALRVYIPAKGINTVYNYGIFNFDTPNFYLKFTLGRLMYSLAQNDYRQFVYSYNYWGQALYEQKLLLTDKENYQLVQLLEENNLPQNRYYRYGFFYDNCATRIRDIVEKAVDGKIAYPSTYIPKKETLRQLVGNYLGNTPWVFFGTNILLGTGTDTIARISHYMFLPEHLRDIYSQSFIQAGDSLRKLTGTPVELFPATLVLPKPNPIHSPVTIMAIILFITLLITWFEKKNNWKANWFDKFLFLITGLLGILITVLWIGSLHLELENNFNIFWANPLNLLIGGMLFFKERSKWFNYLVRTYAIILVCFIPFSYFLTQSIPVAAYFITGILIVRSWAISRKK